MQDWVKRSFDLFFAVFFLILLSPLFILIGILVRADSVGPIFYRGLRTGLKGKPFYILKFRSMYVDRMNVPEGTTALNDFRVTRVGKWIRKFKLDELPQLINIVKGEMSVVGPRPELPRYTQLYKGDELKILSVRPGLTDFGSVQFSSLDQVVGAENADAVFEQKVLPLKNQLRVKYVEERSLFLDLKLIGATVQVIFRKMLCS